MCDITYMPEFADRLVGPLAGLEPSLVEPSVTVIKARKFMPPEDDEKYNLIFRGVLAKSVEPAEAKRNLGQLFKIDSAKVEALFAGKPVVLKRGLTLDVATKYRVAIKKAGALVDVEMQTSTPAKPAGKAAFAVPAAESTADKSLGAIPGAGTDLGAIPGTSPASVPQVTTTIEPADGEAPAAVPVTEPSPLPHVEELGAEFTLAPVGADLLKPEEHSQVAAVVVDTSGLSIKAASGNLLEPTEYRQDDALALDLSGFDLAEAGADVLKPEERKTVEPVEVDITAISLAEPGGNLASPKPAPPPAPDVSGISLEDG